MLDQTKNYTRYMLRHLIKYDKPYIVCGVYQKHRDESERITFINVHPFIPGRQNKETCCLFDHVHLFMNKLEPTCPEWRELLKDGHRYCIVCYSKPYRDNDGVQRCGIVPTLDGMMSPIMDYDKLQEELWAYQPLIERVCVDWEQFMAGRWLKESEVTLYSASQCVQDNCRHKNKVLRQKEIERKKRKRSQSIWNVINMKVS